MLDRLYEKSKGQCSDSIDVDRINPHEGEIIAAHHFDGLRTTAGLVECRVVVVVVKRAYLLRSRRRKFIEVNSRFVVSVGTRLIGRLDPPLVAWFSWQEHLFGGTCQGRGITRTEPSWRHLASDGDSCNFKSTSVAPSSCTYYRLARETYISAVFVSIGFVLKKVYSK